MRILQIPVDAELYYDFGAGLVLLSDTSTIPAVNPALLTIKFTNVTSVDSVTSIYAMLNSEGIADLVGADYAIKRQSTPLPLTLIAFEANSKPDNIQISWTTVSKKGVKGFEIQRSTAMECYWVSAGIVR